MFIDSHLPPSGYQSSLYVSFDLRHYIFDIAKQHWQFYKGIYSYWWAIAHASVRRPTFIGVAMLPSREHMVCDGLCGEMIGTETIRMTIEVKRCVKVLRRAKIMFGIRAWVGYHDHNHQNRDWVGLAEAAEPLACIRSPTFALTLKNLSTQLIHQLIDQSQKKKKENKNHHHHQRERFISPSRLKRQKKGEGGTGGERGEKLTDQRRRFHLCWDQVLRIDYWYISYDKILPILIQ